MSISGVGTRASGKRDVSTRRGLGIKITPSSRVSRFLVRTTIGSNEADTQEIRMQVNQESQDLPMNIDSTAPLLGMLDAMVMRIFLVRSVV